MKKFIPVLLLGTCLTLSAGAELVDAVRAFDKADYNQAYPEFVSLASEGNATAAYYLGRMYRDGLGVNADTDKAMAYFEQADRGHHPQAAVDLGQMVIKGEGTLQNPELGLQYLKKAAYAGNNDALYTLGTMYEKGEGVEKNYTYAFGFFYMAALNGDSRSQLKVGKYYLTGRGIPQDYKEAVKWYTRSANQGFVPAQQEWADLRANNARLRNPLDAYSWYSILAAYNSDEAGRNAAARRDEIAQKFEGQILTEQQKKIMAWRPVSAERSVPARERAAAIQPIIPGFNDEETIKTRLDAGDAFRTDGTSYGITADMVNMAVASGDKTILEKAVEEAVAQGQSAAFGYYGDVLRSRFNDDTTAMDWYRKGAEAGDSYAQFQFAKSHCEGRGIDNPDIGVCYGWMLMAAQSAGAELKPVVDNALIAIEAAATPEELKKGKELAAQQTADKKPEAASKPGLFNLF